MGLCSRWCSGRVLRIRREVGMVLFVCDMGMISLRIISLDLIRLLVRSWGGWWYRVCCVQITNLAPRSTELASRPALQPRNHRFQSPHAHDERINPLPSKHPPSASSTSSQTPSPPHHPHHRYPLRLQTLPLLHAVPSPASPSPSTQCCWHYRRAPS